MPKTGCIKSFFYCFVKELGYKSDKILSAIRNPSNKRIFEQMLKIEFKTQSRWIGYDRPTASKSYFPRLAWLACVANDFKCGIIIYCDSMSFAFLHGKEQIIKICPEYEDRTIVIGIDNNGNMINLKREPGFDLQKVTKKISDSAIIILEKKSENDDEDIDSNSSFSEDEAEDEIEILGDEVDELEPLINENDEEDDDVKKFYKKYSKTVKEVINEFKDYENCPQSDYTDEYSIDFESSDCRFEERIKVQFERTHDIDGFFCALEPQQLCQVVQSSGSIVPLENVLLKKDKAFIKKLFLDSKITLGPHRSIVRFGELTSENRFELFAVVSSDEVITFDLKQALIKAHRFANEFLLCDSCPLKQFHRSIRNSRPEDVTQIKASGFKWEYDQNSFRCMLRHMAIYLQKSSKDFGDLKVHFALRVIGSKFKSIGSDISNISNLIVSFLEPLNLEYLFSSAGPMAFFDLSLKLIPTHPLMTEKVNTLFIFITYFLVGRTMERFFVPEGFPQRKYDNVSTITCLRLRKLAFKQIRWMYLQD